MSAHLARARLLLAQSRPAEAEREAGLALAAQPDDTGALALLALSRSLQKKAPEALEAARSAIGLVPDSAHLHYVHALVLHRADRDGEARAAIAEAIRLDPEDAGHFSLLASIELARGDWSATLAAAEQSLALDPEHINAANLRAMALVRLGRKTEAMQTVDFALHRAPENAFSHANQGWNCLHNNDPRKAQEHFHEALRLEPDLEYARQGMLNALKARNPVYRAMLAYFLWMGRLSRQLQWAVILGVYFGNQTVRGLSEAQPQLKWLWWPLLGLLYAFAYLSWTAGPMFNLLLRFDRYGRHVLSRDQRIASNWFGALFGATLACLVWWLATGRDGAILATVCLAILSVCVAATFSRTGPRRTKLAVVTGLLAFVAGSMFLLLLAGSPAGLTLVTVFIYGFLGFQFFANTQRE